MTPLQEIPQDFTDALQMQLAPYPDLQGGSLTFVDGVGIGAPGAEKRYLPFILLEHMRCTPCA